MTAKPAPVTVAVVNDHELIVKGIAAMLEPFADQVRIVELDTELPVKTPVDVALYDTFTRTNLEDTDLDDLLENPSVGRVVLFTWVLTEELAASARAKGVQAAIPKTLDGAQLASALTHAHEGRLDTIEPVGEPTNPSHEWPGRDQGLTAREAEIIALVSCGLSNNEIAVRTYLSINSVKSYIRSAYRTMGVTSRSQAVLWGVDHGMRPSKMRMLIRNGGSVPKSVAATPVPRS